MLIARSAIARPEVSLYEQGIHAALSFFFFFQQGEVRKQAKNGANKVKGEKKERVKSTGEGRTALRECVM